MLVTKLESDESTIKACPVLSVPVSPDFLRKVCPAITSPMTFPLEAFESLCLSAFCLGDNT